jgi:hypothetical protein
VAIPASGRSSAQSANRPPQHAGRHGQQQRNGHRNDPGRGGHRNGGQRNGPKRNGHSSQQAHGRNGGNSRPQAPQANQGPRPVASTQPIGSDFSKVSFMQPR